MNLFDQIINQAKLGTSWQFSGGTSFWSINTHDFQSKLPTIQKSVQAEENLRNQGFSEKEVKFLKLQKEKWVDMNKAFAFVEQKRQEEKKANQFQIPTTEWFQMHETLPISKLENFKMKRTEWESLPVSIGKMIVNAPASAWEVLGGAINLWSTFLQEWVKWGLQWDNLAWPKALYNTIVWWVLNPTLSWLQSYGSDIWQAYKEGGTLNAINTGIEWATKFVEENPMMILPLAKKPLSSIKKTGEFVNPYLSKTFQKIPVPESVKNFWNARAEQLLSSQWKLDKPTRQKIQAQVGETGAKFALERDIVGKDIETTADNAWLFKIAKIEEKMNAVKSFWKTATPEVARNVANVIKNDIIDWVTRSYWKDVDVLSVLEQNHPELASVLKLTEDVIKSKKTDYVKLEQLKEIHDYLNPEGIQYDVTWKPISETRNLISVGKRSKLQQILENEWNRRWVDIKWINRDIQGAYNLEKWLNNAISRIQNLNILGLGDTQIATISAILWGAPWAVGSLLVKRWLQSEWFRASLAKKLYTKTPKNVTTNPLNPDMTVTPPVTRLGRIMNINSNTPITIKPKRVIKKESVKPSPQVKPVEKVETMTKWEAILYRKNGKIYAKDNQATRDALKRSGIDIEPDGEIKKQLTFYPEDDFRPDVTPKTVKPVEKKVKPKK